MHDRLLQLYPPPSVERALAGLYLNHELHRASGPPGLPYIYTNFISSLDGRISLPDPITRLRDVPPAIANPRDWHLFLELAAQADVLLTTSRHLRAVAAGRHHGIFDLACDPHLAPWRTSRGLPVEPVIAAVSENLVFDVKAIRACYAGSLLALTGANAPRQRMAELRSEGVEVVQLTGMALDGAALAQALGARGYGRVYSMAGPRVTHALLEARVIERLYVTTVPIVLGGRDFDTLTLGDALDPPARFRLHSMYHDAAAPAGTGQLFASYERVH
jgi:riboflavin biosynthesis pyrimidine reductase